MESIDLNLLRTFALVCKSGSLKRAGIRLGISESAVSKQMAKLREQLEQPLFERTSQGLQPTHYSRSILAQVEQALSSLDTALAPSEFDPTLYTGSITLAFFANTLEFSGVKIFEQIRACFPLAQIELKAWSSETEQRILDGEITLGVHFLIEERSSDIFQKRITADRLVVAVSAELNSLTWQQAIEMPFIKIRSQGWNEERYRYIDLLRQQGVELEISVTVDNFSFARQLMLKGQHACVLSSAWQDPALRVIEPPEHLQLPLVLVSCMRLVDRDSPLHLELHQAIKAAMS